MNAAQKSDLDHTTRGAWQPVLAFAYATAGAAVAQFLAAGFTSIARFMAVLGAFVSTPAERPLVGFAVLLVLGCIVSLPIARVHLEAASDTHDVVNRLIVVFTVAVILLLPITQWLTFGRPDAARRYHGAAAGAGSGSTAREAKHA